MKTALVLGLLVVWCDLTRAAVPSGEDLYLGRAPASAQMRGDDRPLPTAAVVCANCHEPAVTGVSIGPRLDAGLLQSLPRRGGPPMAFDETSFCRLLRTGIDPVMVLVRRTMPMFRFTDAECAGLWQYLSQRPALAREAR